MKKLNIPLSNYTENWKIFQKDKRYQLMFANRTDQYVNKEHYEAEQIIKYGYTRILVRLHIFFYIIEDLLYSTKHSCYLSCKQFEKLPEMMKDFTVGLALIEQLPNIAPFLLESAAYRIMLLIVNSKIRLKLEEMIIIIRFIILEVTF